MTGKTSRGIFGPEAMACGILILIAVVSVLIGTLAAILPARLDPPQALPT